MGQQVRVHGKHAGKNYQNFERLDDTLKEDILMLCISTLTKK
jgi:hypothetical protein